MKKKQWLQLPGRLFWPEVCPFCGKASREGICAACRKRLDELVITEPRCMQCGKPVRYQEEEYCRDCAHTQHHYDRGMSLWLHKPPVSTSIYQFKYYNQRNYGECYAEELARSFADLVKVWRPNLIIPIPLHPRRRRKRGYNQAAILAEHLSGFLHIPVEKEALIRRKYTSPQKKLDRKERRENLKGVFAVTERFVPSPRVLLVDDIYTTGNTMDAAAKILKECGVEKVYFFTISIGQGY